MVIVLLVIGILGTAVLPRMFSITQVAAIAAADLAATEIRAAQSKAMYSGIPQSIAFSGTSYTTDAITKPLPGDSTSTSFTVVFNSFGEPSFDDGNSFQISSGSSVKTITISALTGKVTIN